MTLFPEYVILFFIELKEKHPPPPFLLSLHLYRLTKYHFVKHWFSDTHICGQHIYTIIQHSDVSASKIASELDMIKICAPKTLATEKSKKKKKKKSVTSQEI